jgi:VWFA-related protein
MSGAGRILTIAAAFAALSQIVTLGQVKTQPRPKLGTPPAESRPAATLRIDTNLVLVPVSVLDPTNHPVTGLEKEHFRVLEDRVEQAITHFSMDDEPVAVGLVFDISGSKGPKLQKSRQAAAEFFRTSNIEDEFFLVEFNDQPKWWCLSLAMLRVRIN